MPTRSLVAGLLLALSPLALTTALAAKEAPASAPAPVLSPAHAPAPDWPFEASDIPADSEFRFLRLPSGLRVIIRRNATPEGTALVRMRIDSGSLEETESERGLSHFLEHMAFNGSKGIPEGEMIKLLEREGLAFGADTNASTGFDAVTYMLNLPRNDAALLETALKLMRETASELTIAEDAVARERGVILAEKRDRAGFQLRNFEDNAAFLAPGARYPQRLPIGTDEVIQTASAARLRELYARTYTPANTVLVVVGDFPVDAVEAAIRARFGDWLPDPARSPDPGTPEAGPFDTTRAALADIHLDPALDEQVTISRLSPWRLEADTIATREARLLRSIGYGIINRRLARLARQADAPFRGASFSTGDLFEEARLTSLSIASADGAWRKGVLAATREVNEALSYGFTRAELDEQLANLRTAYENAVNTAATRTHEVHTAAALALAADDRIPTTPQWQLALFERLAPALTPAAVWQAVLADAAPLEEPLIRFAGRTAPEGGEDALRAAFAQGLALPIAAPAERAAAAFAYGDFGAPGTVVAEGTEPRLGLSTLTFANGVRLTLKPTDIRKDRIAFAMAVDGGELMNSREAPLATALTDALALGGLGKHSQDELTSVLAGRSVGFGLSASADAFTSSGTTTARDLALQLQVLAATLSDPGYRPEGVERFRKAIANNFANLDATPGRALGAALGGILSDNDPRFTLQPEAAYLALDYAGLEAVIGERLRRGAIELALVGDFDPAAAIAAVANTLGALPPREAAFQPRTEARARSFTATRSERVLTHKGEADQALIQWVWPTTDDSDHAQTLRLALLARVMRIVLTDKLREELGQAYSPGAGSSASRIYPGYGTFSVSASVAVSEVDATRKALTELVAELAAKPLAADMIERARRPLLEDYANALKGLDGWLDLAQRAQSDAARIDRFLAAPDVLNAITPEALHAEAQRWLGQEPVKVLVVPAGSPQAPAAPPTPQ